jgi:hypothetical protein
MTRNIEDKVVFGVCPGGEGDGVPLVLLGIPKGAWEYMKDGKTHNFDLTKAGIPVKLMLYGGDSHSHCMKMIEAHLSKQDLPYWTRDAKIFQSSRKGNTNTGPGAKLGCGSGAKPNGARVAAVLATPPAGRSEVFHCGPLHGHECRKAGKILDFSRHMLNGWF